MKERDLLEFLKSTIEEDAIITRIFKLFHERLGYSINELDSIIEFGMNNNILKIESVMNSEIVYDIIDWNYKNNNQEILMTEAGRKKCMIYLFSDNPTIPEMFKKFID